MSGNSSTGSSGLILGLLGVLFVGLKLTGHIDWSWWWVTAPFWAPVVFAIVVYGGVFLWWLNTYMTKGSR